MHKNVVADVRLGNISEIDFFDDPAKAHSASSHERLCSADADDLAGNRQTHSVLPESG
jgi:hypothetical protein